ncbi:hypothetical protein TR51_22890 [Kitasatospora griseola]|uniref:Uncharacterized protein n=1 Tax=Kitasatospora griseola TaxID=2064 RepID=A0A0D0PNH2_KITGR|nr:hypothetical protein TR51_22890 [Kitasatospora griseola]
MRVRGRAAHSLVLRELLLLWEAARQADGRTITRKRLAWLGGIGPSTLNGWLSGRSVPRDVDRLTVVAGELSRAAGRPVRNARYWAVLMEADRAHRSPTAVASSPAERQVATGFPHVASSPTGNGTQPSGEDGDVEALCRCAEILGRTGEIAEALERSEAETEAGHPAAHDRAGQPVVGLDRADEAMSRFEWAPVDGHPEVPATHAGTCAVVGRTDQAIAWWERAWEQGVTTVHEAADVWAAEVWAATGRIGETVWHEAAALSAGHGQFGDLPRFGHIGDHVTLRERGEQCERDGDLVEALSWYRKAAEAGSEAALFQAADMLERNGDHDRAVHWYELAAHRGDTYAMRELGRLLGELGRSRESISWYRAAVRAGDRHALPEVVHVVEQLDRRSTTASDRPRSRPLSLLGPAEEAEGGAVVPQSTTDRGSAGTALLPDAVELLKEAGRYFEADLLLRSADRPESDRLREASRMLSGSVSTDEAIEWVQRFADIGDLQAVSEAAEMLENRGRIDEALDWYARAAGVGDRDALLAAARMLADRHQIERALDWYGRAAEAGVPSAHREAVMLRQQVDEAETAATQRNLQARSAASVVPTQRGQAMAEAGSPHPGAEPAVPSAPASARRVRAPRKSAASTPRQR